jgi:hypothetical protein
MQETIHHGTKAQEKDFVSEAASMEYLREKRKLARLQLKSRNAGFARQAHLHELCSFQIRPLLQLSLEKPPNCITGDSDGAGRSKQECKLVQSHQWSRLFKRPLQALNARTHKQRSLISILAIMRCLEAYPKVSSQRQLKREVQKGRRLNEFYAQ